MHKFVFCVEPFKCDYMAVAETEKQAWQMIWDSFNDEEQNAVRSHELIDVLDIGD